MENKVVYNRSFVLSIAVIASIGGLLFGYDTAVISGAIGFIEKHFSLSPAAVGFAAASALVGCVIGAGLSGVISDYIGRKKALLITAVLYFISAVGCFYSDTVLTLNIFRIIGGIGVGGASMICPLYIAEISPANKRGTMVSLNQLAIVTGILLIYFVNYFIVKMGGEVWQISTSWRYMLGSEAIPALLFFVLLFFVPESPRWLVAQGGELEKKGVSILEKISNKEEAEREHKEILEVVKQKDISVSSLLKPQYIVVFFIGIAIAVFQQVTGINVFLYYAPEIFKSVVKGTQTDIALLQTIVVGVFNMGFTFVAIYTVDKVGRKLLMLIGFAGMTVCLLGLGASAYFQQTSAYVLIFILGYISFFALSVGPVTWVILSEIYPTKIRGRAMAIATLFVWLANYVISQTFPMMDKSLVLVKMFNHAFPFLLYAAFGIMAFIFVSKYVPETKNKSLEEIEKLWDRTK